MLKTMIKLAFPGFRNQFACLDQLPVFRTQVSAKRRKYKFDVCLFLAFCGSHLSLMITAGNKSEAVQAQIQYVDQCYRSPTNPKQLQVPQLSFVGTFKDF